MIFDSVVEQRIIKTELKRPVIKIDTMYNFFLPDLAPMWIFCNDQFSRWWTMCIRSFLFLADYLQCVYIYIPLQINHKSSRRIWTKQIVQSRENWPLPRIHLSDTRSLLINIPWVLSIGQKSLAVASLQSLRVLILATEWLRAQTLRISDLLGFCSESLTERVQNSAPLH